MVLDNFFNEDPIHQIRKHGSPPFPYCAVCNMIIYCLMVEAFFEFSSVYSEIKGPNLMDHDT